jgi:hypothetical protein
LDIAPPRRRFEIILSRGDYTTEGRFEIAPPRSRSEIIPQKGDYTI